MFEIGIFCVILLAISYWAVLWLMGRRDDVLHGEFVQTRAEANDPARPIFPEPPARSVFPDKPIIAEKPVRADITKPARTAVAEQPAFRPERLQSLLNELNEPVKREALYDLGERLKNRADEAFGEGTREIGASGEQRLDRVWGTW